MTYISVSGSDRRPNVLAAAVLALAIGGCGGSSDGGAAGNGGTGGTIPPNGCIVQNFSGEPDIIFFPEFDMRSTGPGQDVNVKFWVDSDTRLAKVTLRDGWRLDPTPPEQGRSETLMQSTAGDELLEFAIPMESTGRYYADVELCAFDCADQRVVYTLNRANAGEMSDAINDPYERILYEDETETRSSFTCDHPNSIAIQ